MGKAIQLTDAAIQELSIVTRHDENGVEFAPRNSEARMLAVKGSEKGLAAKVIETVKGYFASPQDEPVGSYPVSEAVDNIDNDGDGPEDYSEIACAIARCFNDIQSALNISDDSARSAAIVKCIDALLAGVDAMRSGAEDSDKAGARHSEADRERLNAIAIAQVGIGEHVAAIQGHLEALGVTGAASSNDGKTGKDLDDGPEDSHDNDKAAAKGGKYGDVDYADEKNKKYPIDTEEHARAAWSYINQEKNAAEYSSDELAEIKSRIRAACKRFGIEISDDKAAPVTEKSAELEMTQEELDAKIAEAAQKAAEAAVAAVTAASAATVAKAKSEAEEKAAKAQADADAAVKAAKADAEAAEARAHKADETLRLASGLAAQPAAGSATANKGGLTKLQAVMHAQMKLNPESHVI